MRAKVCRLACFLMIVMAICCASCGEKSEDQRAEEGDAPTYTAADSLNWSTFVAYLQEHFDDFHDVTMRYHHMDHTINGIVELKMIWEDGRLKSADVLSNETGSADLPGSLIEKMRTWTIEDIAGPAEIVLPVNVKIVGLDDPDFSSKSILTGEVRDTDGTPIQGAMIMIKPQVAGIVMRAETNREGVFVRTLIPPGTWNLECSHPDYEPAAREGVELPAGGHVRIEFQLE